MSITSRPPPGPAPAAQARRSASPSTRSSWRTCPKVNERRKVPSVDGAIALWPRTASVPPARKRSQSSIESAPAAIACRKREHLATRLRGPRSLAQVDRLVDQPLDLQPVRERRRQHQPGVGDQPLVVELCRQRIGLGGGSRTVHHMSDLLMSGRGGSIQPLFACSGGHFRAEGGRITIGRSVDPGLERECVDVVCPSVLPPSEWKEERCERS